MVVYRDAQAAAGVQFCGEMFFGPSELGLASLRSCPQGTPPLECHCILKSQGWIMGLPRLA